MKHEWNFTRRTKNNLAYIKLVQTGEYSTKFKEMCIYALQCQERGMSNYDATNIRGLFKKYPDFSYNSFSINITAMVD
jgi:hypothetical protein